MGTRETPGEWGRRGAGRRMPEGRNTALRDMLRSKLHLATVTRSDLHYEGSLSVDRDLMTAVGLLPHERVVVINVTSGARFETYAIPAPSGSREIGVFGGAARLACIGDRLIVMTFARVPEEQARDWHPSIAILDEENRVKRSLGPEGA